MVHMVMLLLCFCCSVKTPSELYMLPLTSNVSFKKKSDNDTSAKSHIHKQTFFLIRSLKLFFRRGGAGYELSWTFTV